MWFPGSDGKGSTLLLLPCLWVSAHQAPVGASPLLWHGNGRFLFGSAIKAAQTQPAFIITLWSEPEHGAFPEMPVWNKNNLKILHFYLFSHITSLCCSPPPLSLTQGFFFFFCLHPSLACALQGEIPGLQTAEPAVQCHVKGKQTPAIQELKWLSWSVVSVKMESTKQIILEITWADFAAPGEVSLCVVLALMASLIEMF